MGGAPYTDRELRFLDHKLHFTKKETKGREGLRSGRDPEI